MHAGQLRTRRQQRNGPEPAIHHHLAANAHQVMPPLAAQEFLCAAMAQDWRKNETAEAKGPVSMVLKSFKEKSKAMRGRAGLLQDSPMEYVAEKIYSSELTGPR